MTSSEQAPSSPPSGSRTWALVFLFLVLALVAAVRIRLLNLPLERDEGEFAYAGQMLLHGISPYKAAYPTMLKLPGTCGVYALIMALFGQTAAAIHAGVLLANLASAVLVFVIARRIYGGAAAVIAAGTYVLLSMVPETLGLAAHATHFVVLPMLAGIVLLQNLDDRTRLGRIFMAGLFIGLAIMMKQTGAVFGLFAAGWVARHEFSSGQKEWRRLVARLAWLALGGLLPFILTCGVITVTGDLKPFWLWTFEFAAAHASVITLGQGLQTMTSVVVLLFQAAPQFWCFAGLGVAAIFLEPTLQRWRHFLAGFAFFSCLAAWPGWRPHYFIQLLPAAGLLTGAAAHWFSGWVARRASALSSVGLTGLIFTAAVVSLLIRWNGIFFNLTPAEASRAIYGANPFPESVPVARYLAEHSAPNARILVLGSEPQIYFYSRRRAATGFICSYPLMESQPYATEMQRQMIQEIEKNDPEYVVFVRVDASWLQNAGSNPLIFKWFDQYQREHLNLVGLVEIQPGEPTQYHWYSESPTNLPTTAESWLAIFRNRSAGKAGR